MMPLEHRFNLLEKEWDIEKNKGVKLSSYEPGSNKDAWWICEKGHSWKTRIAHRYNGSGCPICANRVVECGYNDLKTTFPIIASEWNYEKNEYLLPTDVVFSTPKKVWWKCKKGHEWEASISQRTRSGSGCPICAGRVAWKGVNDLQTLMPEIAKSWDGEKNGLSTPYDYTVNSSKKVWWKCSLGHSWNESIERRTKRKECPVCSGKIVIVGINDLLTVRPEIASEWDCEKNIHIRPTDVTDHSDKKIWWKCSKGHSWQAKVRNRCMGAGCLVCCNQRIVKGINDLATTNPNLATEWNYEKNGECLPTNISANSPKKYWWKCNRCNNEWQATAHSRNAGKGCPRCAVRKHSSLPEQTIYYYIKQVYPDAHNSYKDLFERQMELDIYIPSLNVGIEYDGAVWHSKENAQTRDREKYKVCKKKGIYLIRIKELEDDNDDNIGDYIIYTLADGSTESFIKVFGELSIKLPACNLVDIDIDRDRARILGQFQQKIDDSSLLQLHPEIAAEWDEEKNNPLKPEAVYANSNEKVWWICKKGHSWVASIDNRVKGNGCPACSGRIAIEGKTDLKSLFPELICEWDYSINEKGPECYTSKSNKKVSWICCKGHKWSAVISSRTSGSGCPICAGRQVLIGYNDFAFQNPIIAQEWDDEKNQDITPQMFTSKSNKKVWWKCRVCGHSWHAKICNRVSGTGCPACAKRKNAGSFGKA